MSDKPTRVDGAAVRTHEVRIGMSVYWIATWPDQEGGFWWEGRGLKGRAGTLQPRASDMGLVAEQLMRAEMSLDEKNWHRESYFIRGEGGSIMMCAHAAIQVQSSPAVREALLTLDGMLDLDEVLSGVAVANVAAHESAYLGMRKAWACRPFWMMARPELEPAYVAGLVGLTALYNDMVAIDVYDVKVKMLRAAHIADMLGL